VGQITKVSSKKTLRAQRETRRVKNDTEMLCDHRESLPRRIFGGQITTESSEKTRRAQRETRRVKKDTEMLCEHRES
jgi:hypothetical protein